MERENLKSRLGFILLSAGCAIGIGNVWKFPYMAGQGGGAFVLFYVLFLIILGLPIMTMEFAVGRARGLQNGLEKVTKVMMIALLVIMVILAINSLFMPGASEGLKFYLVPDFARMKEVGVINTLVGAMNQAFFMPSLIFITLPNIFANMNMGRLWGSLFFLFMAFAALSTVLAVFENIICCGMELTGCSRKKSSAVNFVLITLLSVPCVLGYNVWAWDGFAIFGGAVLDLEELQGRGQYGPRPENARLSDLRTAGNRIVHLCIRNL